MYFLGYLFLTYYIALEFSHGIPEGPEEATLVTVACEDVSI